MERQTQVVQKVLDYVHVEFLVVNEPTLSKCTGGFSDSNFLAVYRGNYVAICVKDQHEGVLYIE